MSSALSIVVCGSIVPDPLQTLEPVFGERPSLKNESMLPSVLDPWAAHSLYEAANLAKKNPGSKVYLVSVGPKAKIQQLMMTIAQKVSFELVVVDGPAGGFIDSYETAEALANAIEGIAIEDRSKLFIFGGMASATRDAGTTIPMVAERLGIHEFFMGVDELEYHEDGSFKVKERLEGGSYLVSECSSTPAAIAWATGNLPEPANNPQIGMANMRGIMPAIQKAKPVQLPSADIKYTKAEIPSLTRQTKIVKDMAAKDIAAELLEWIKA